MASRLAVLMALIALAAVAGCDADASVAGQAYPSPSPSTIAPTARAHEAPAALLHSAIAAMLAKGSVHVSCTEYASDDVTTSSDVSVDSGSSADTITTQGSVKALLVGGASYIYVSKAAVLVGYGFPESVAAQYAGRWLSFNPGDSYGLLSSPLDFSDLTIETMAGQLQLTGSLTSLGLVPDNGQMAVGVSGNMAAVYGSAAKGSKETVYIQSSGIPLPVTVSQRISGVLQVCNYSHWGEPLHLTPPPDAVPVTSLPKDSGT